MRSTTVLIALFFACIAGCSSAELINVTQAQYDKIKTKMTEKEVIEILGDNYKILMETSIGGHSSKTIQWANSEESVAVISFVDGVVEAKSSSMLPK